MKRKITFLLSALCAVMLITQPVKVLGQTRASGTFVKVTDASSLSSGDILIFVDETANKAAGNISSQIMTANDVTISSSTISTTSNDIIELTLGGSSGSWTFSNSSSQLLGATAVKKLAWGSGTTTWSISISNGNATIQNGTSTYGTFLYNNGSPRFTTYTSAPTSSMRLPQLYRKVCTVTYNHTSTSGTGSGTMTDSNSPYIAGRTVTVLSNAFTAPDGMMFNGWNTKSDGTGTSYAAGATFKITANTVLYAQWTPITHTITYSATNGSIGGVVYNTSTPVASGASVAEGGKVTLTATPASGYSFSSWEVSGTGATLSSTTTNPTTFTMGTANATVTANFTATGGSTTYSVTYNANGATSGNVPTDGNSYEANYPVTVLGNTGNLVKTGYAFSGWCMNAEGTGTVYGPNNTTSFNITANTTLYAKWTPYTITAASNNNDYGTVQLSGTVITATPAAGYTYASTAYTVSPGSATVVQNGNEFTVTPTSNCTVTINFAAIPTHTVTFSVNGNTNTSTFYEGQTITFPANPAAIGGKSFVGWLKNSTINGTTNVAPSIVNTSTETMDNSDVIYYAVFAEVTPGTQTTLTDELNYSFVGVTSSTYTSWSDKTGTSGAVYAGQSAGGDNNSGNCIQIRSNNSNSGIITTTSGGKAKKVTVTWNSATADDRTLDIYGKNSAYSAASDLYSNSTQGTKIGSIVNGTSTELTINNDYEYIGLRSNSGAMYLDEIDIEWTSETPDTYSNYCTSVVVTYSVTYDGNGATSGDVPTDATAYSPNASVTVLGNTGNLAKTGYTFGGWNTQNDGQGTNYAANATFSITANTTLYAKWNVKTCTNLTAAGTPTTTTYSAGESFDPTGLTVTATYNDASQEVVTTLVTWTPDPLTQGTTSVTGTYMGQTVNVNGLTVNATPGSADNPYTVAQAIYAINNSGTVNGVYVTGIISQIDSYSSEYHSLTYWISPDGETNSTQFEVYSGKGIGGADFNSTSDLAVGDEVVVTGDIKKYNSVYEFNYNNELVSLKLVAPTFSHVAGAVTSGTTVAISAAHTGSTIYYTTDGTNPTNESTVYSTPISITTATTINAIAVKSGYTTSDVATAGYTILVTPTITVTAENPINVSAAGGSGELALTYENFTITQVSDFDVQFYDANDQAISSQNKPTWITVNVATATPSGYKVTYSVQANDGAARSAYFKVDALDDNTELVYSNKVTVTQAAADYTTLPFEYTDEDVNSDLTLNNMPNGVTQEGLGTYPSSTPRLKFDTQGDYLVLKLNTAPVQISYDIKGNSFSGGTFTVQLSADGEDYEDLAEYTTLDNKTQKITHICNNSNVRYIKWIYTNRSSGNVALGNINVNANSPTINNLTIATGETLTVSDGAILTLTGTVTNNGAIVIEDGGQLVTKISGITATVKKNVEEATNWGDATTYDADGWYFIASPVNGASYNTAITTGSGEDYDLFMLDWDQKKWLNKKDDNNSSVFGEGFTRGKGYLYASKAGNTLSVAGTIQPLSDDDNATVTLANDGWNLIGNPLTCKVTVSCEFGSLNNGSTVDYTANTVNPFQGIAVYGNAGTTVTFTKATTQNAADPSNNISLQMTLAKKVTSRGETSSKVVDNAVVSFSESKGLPKFNMLGGNVKLYIPQNDEEYAVAFSNKHGDVPLNFKADELGTYTISFTGEEMDLNGIYLIDMLDEVEIDLSVEPSYTFIGSPADRSARFKIVFRNVNGSNDSDIFAYQSGSDIVVSGEGELQIFDVMGRMVARQNVNGVQTINAMAHGVYIFKLNEKTQKIIVK